MKKALQYSWLRLFLSFWEDVLGVTNIEQGIQSCQTQEPPSTLGHSSAAHVKQLPPLLWGSAGRLYSLHPLGYCSRKLPLPQFPLLVSQGSQL